MVAKIRFHTAAALDGLEKDIEREAVEITNKAVNGVYNELLDTTPVRTGNLVSGWFQRQGARRLRAIHNDVEYLKYVNDGSTKQIGQKFIQRALLKFGIRGSIDYF